MQSRLSPIYGSWETKAISRLIFHNLKGWNATDLIIHEGDEISDYIAGKIEEILRRLDREEPIQYILGEGRFYGMNLKVGRAVLIPRPETEELVDIIVKQNASKQDLRVLDIGTGSGAIAIALARNLPFSRVTALDISPDALEIARENATALKTDINFINDDVFKWVPGEDTFDIIVSNPPYVDESEKRAMERNVIDYEPHTALFVPDANPLIFYSRIAEIASNSLAAGGTLYFEINPRHCDELLSLLRNEGFSDVEIFRDIQSRLRFISAKKK